MALFIKDAERSINATEKFAAPALKQFFGSDAQIFSIENHNSRVEEILDRDAGIDSLVLTGRGVYPVALRAQFGKCWATTTIRRSRPSGSKTEYEKITHATEFDALKVNYHCHIYVASDGLSATVGVAWTNGVMDIVRANPSRWQKNPEDGTTFFFAPWIEVKQLKVYRVDASGHVEEITDEYSST